MTFGRRFVSAVSVFAVLLLALAYLSPLARPAIQRLVDGEQHPLPPVEAPVEAPVRMEMAAKRVAIIGAGSAGSSTAHFLRKYLASSPLSSSELSVTVYDRNPYIGGRSTTVNAYDDPAEPVELGASIFVSVNENLVNAASEFGLSYSGSESDSSRLRPRQGGADILGVYNGEKLVFTYPEKDWLAMAKIIMRYGPLAPWRTKKLTETVVGKFLQMYRAPLFPFSSLSDVAESADLVQATGLTGEQFLTQNGITGGFASEMIQASTRVNYGQNLGLIHGLETMVCMAAEGAVSIQGGNWRIFDAMVNSSASDVRLSTSVSSLTKSSETGKWTVLSSTSEGDKSDTFDAVVLAAPLQFTNISISPALEKIPDEIPYATLHVTLFTSPLRLSPGFFGLGSDSPVPPVILTTLNATEQADPAMLRGEGKNGVGSVGFFSISALREIVRERPDGSWRVEYLYKVFSPEKFPDNKILEILGATGTEDEAVIGWMYRHVWKAYPYLYPRVTFEDIKVADGMWYTGGIESFISTMETSSLMGMNVARLVVDEWESEAKAKAASMTEEPAQHSELKVKAKL